jgi:hypothetical protein
VTKQTEAEIRRLFFGEHWKKGRSWQLGMHDDVVARVVILTGRAARLEPTPACSTPYRAS